MGVAPSPLGLAFLCSVDLSARPAPFFLPPCKDSPHPSNPACAPMRLCQIIITGRREFLLLSIPRGWIRCSTGCVCTPVFSLPAAKLTPRGEPTGLNSSLNSFIVHNCFSVKVYGENGCLGSTGKLQNWHIISLKCACDVGLISPKLVLLFNVWF